MNDIKLHEELVSNINSNFDVFKKTLIELIPCFSMHNKRTFERIRKKVYSRYMKINQNDYNNDSLIDIVLKCMCSDINIKKEGFAQIEAINELFSKSLEIAKSDRKIMTKITRTIKNALNSIEESTHTNNSEWVNYINELALFVFLSESKNTTVKEIEHILPNGKSIDFFCEIDGRVIGLEAFTKHSLESDIFSTTVIKEHIIADAKTKYEDKTNGLKDQEIDGLDELYIVPIILYRNHIEKLDFDINNNPIFPILIALYELVDCKWKYCIHFAEDFQKQIKDCGIKEVIFS